MTALQTVPSPGSSSSQASPQSKPSAGSGGQPPAGGGAPSWRDSLPEEIRAESAFDSIKAKDSAEAFPIVAKRFVEAHKLVGADKIAVPGEKASAGDWDAVYGRLGRPSDPKGYKVPEGSFSEADQPVLQSFMEQAHKAGLSDRQFGPLVNWYRETTGQQALATQAATADARAAAEKTLRGEWGAGYDDKLAAAKAGAAKFGLSEFFSKDTAGNDPAVLRAFAQIGRMVTESSVQGGKPAGAGAMDAAGAATEIEKLMLDSEFVNAWGSHGHPGHKAAIKKYMDLMAIAHPGEMTIGA